MRRFFSVLFFLAMAVVARAQAPTVSALGATPSDHQAVLRATVTANGNPTVLRFDYGPTTAYGASSLKNVDATATNEVVEVTVPGLANGTYHFKATVTNVDGTASTLDATFIIGPDLNSPVPTVSIAANGTVTLTGEVTANGVAGQAYFEVGPTLAYGTKNPDPAVTIAAGDVDKAVVGVFPGLNRDQLYHYRFVFVDASNAVTATADKTFIATNAAPVAAPDTFVLRGTGAAKLDVLANDTDSNGDALEITAVTDPQHGTATITGAFITYQPGSDFSGSDQFSYTIEDEFGASATAQVTISSPQGAASGTHGGFVKDLKGKEVGYFLMMGTSRGSFTGEAKIDGHTYRMSGRLAPDGSYSGAMWGNGEKLTVELAIEQGSGAATLDATFDGGRWTAEVPTGLLSQEQQLELAGRYTVTLPGSGGGSDAEEGDDSTSGPPAGTGWAIIKVRPDGSASLKGKLPDGRSFSSKGVIGAAESGVALTFFDDPKDTRVIGNLTIGDDVGGEVRVDRDKTNSDFFPSGYDTTLTADGARYVQPIDGRRALETGDPENDRLTISFADGDLDATFSRNLRLTENDKVEVLNPGDDKLSVKIDRNTGRFTAKFRLSDRSNRKGTGVLIQGADGGGSGAGVFLGVTESGSIEISVTSDSTEEDDTAE